MDLEENSPIFEKLHASYLYNKANIQFDVGVTGCSLNFVFFFENFKIYFGLRPLSGFPQ